MWCVTLALAASAPILRALTGARGIEKWPVYTCAVLMLLIAFTTRKLSNSFLTAILMSASAIGLGAGIGFLTLALIYGKTIQYFLPLKWLVGGAFLLWLYLKQLRRLGEFEPTSREEELR